MFSSNSGLRSSKAKPNRTPDQQPRNSLTPKSFHNQNSKLGLFTFSKTPTVRDKPKPSQSYSRFQSKPQRPLTSKNTDSNSKLASDRKRTSNYSSSKIEARSPFAPRRPTSKSPRRGEEEIVREDVFVVPKRFVIGSREIRHSRNTRPQMPRLRELPGLPNYQPAKHSTRQNGLIQAYAACTNQGPVRDENQDRVAIILNFNKPEHVTDWKKAAYFGVFDGHGGVACADYLRDTLHTAIVKQKSFPHNIPDCLSQAFYRCQATFLQRCKSTSPMQKSGTCAIVVFIYGDTCYIANTGDSRCIMSSFHGDRISELSIDHKPSDEYEQKRIIEAGGKIYQMKLQNAEPGQTIFYQGQDLPFIMGPHRVLPGRLSVTRTFGDIEAKLPEFGGNPRAIISTPEIRSFKLTKDNDFIIIGCDGIYDKLSSDQIIECVWQTSKDRSRFSSLHQFCGVAVQNIMKLSVFKKTADNITVVMIAFESLEAALYPKDTDRTEKSASKIELSKNIRTSTHIQDSSLEKRKSVYIKRPSRESTSRSSIRKPETGSLSLLEPKSSQKKTNSYLKHLSPSPGSGSKSFAFNKY